MTRRYKILAALILLFLGLLVYAEATKPAPINWYPSYGNTDKIPYGLNVLYTTLQQRFGDNFKEVNRPPYEVMLDGNTTLNGTYFFVNDAVNFDEAETQSLLEWVEKGNTLYVASSSVSETLLDTLSLEIEYYYDLDNFDRKPLVNLSNPMHTRDTPYSLDIDVTTSYFTEIDTMNTVVLGVYDLQKDKVVGMEEPKVNFIRQAFGDGFIYLHLLPESFTNYFMLYKNNYEYTNVAQLYIDEETPIYWDNHYKNSKTFYGSPLYMIYKSRYLKWAWYVLLIGVLLWVFFEGKRKQRAIPVVEPLQNQTIAYTHTIAGMYLEKGDHKSIAYHQINHFLEYLRSNYGLDTSVLGLDFITKASAKTANPVDVTKRLVDLIQYIQQKETLTKEDLEKLDKRLQEYKST